MTANERCPGKAEAASDPRRPNLKSTSTLPEAADIDGHCCTALSWEQREHLGRRGRFCSETRCAWRDLLGGVA